MYKNGTFVGGDDYEIIVIDDGSTDGSERIVDGFASNQQISIVHKENAGVSSARNAGLKLATGEYITFVDADDEVVEGSLTKIVDHLDGQNDICIAGAVQDGQNSNIHIFEEMEFREENAKVALNFILTGGTQEKRIPKSATKFMSGCKEKFYKKKFLDSFEILFDEELGRNEDVLWSCYCYYNAKKIFFLPTTVYINKEDENGITKGTNIEITYQSMKMFLDKFNSFFLDKLDDQTLSNFYFHQSLITTYETYRAFRIGKISRKEFFRMMENWYNSGDIKLMFDSFESGQLSMLKRFAFYMMKIRAYDVVGLEMMVHHKKK